MTPRVATPNLLTLPQELRDYILNFTRAEATIPWLWREHLDDEDLPADIAPITVFNAPIPALLHVNKQLRDEYLYTIKDLKLKATADLDISKVGWMQNEEFEDDQIFRHPKVFQYIHSLTLMIRFSPNTSPLTREPWPHISPLLTAFLDSAAPRLCTLRLVLYQYQLGHVAHHALRTPGFQNDMIDATRLVPFAPAFVNFPGLVLVKSGQGYKLDYGSVVRPQRRSEETGGVWRAGTERVVHHRVTRVGVWMFERGGEADDKWVKRRRGKIGEDGSEDVKLITDEVLLAPRMARGYPDEVLALLDGEGEDVRKWPGEMREWTEYPFNAPTDE